jgi:hypothetical protein
VVTIIQIHVAERVLRHQPQFVRFTRVTCLGFVLISFLPAFGLAQTRESPNVFISGGVAVDDDHTFPGTTLGVVGVAALGVDLSQHVGVRLTLDAATLNDTFGATGVRTFDRSRIAWSALIDGHGRISDRTRLGFLAGVTEERPTWWGITAGTEVAVSVSEHFALVPDLRVIVFPAAEYGRSWIARSGVSVRWRSSE